jgi:hypothetical protein
LCRVFWGESATTQATLVLDQRGVGLGILRVRGFLIREVARDFRRIGEGASYDFFLCLSWRVG